MTALEISLIVVAVVLAAVIAYVMFNYRKFLTKAARRMGRRFNALLRERDDEISRLRAVNSELKQNGADMSRQKVMNPEQMRLLDNEKSILEQKKLE